jgi:hypothetical protein
MPCCLALWIQPAQALPKVSRNRLQMTGKEHSLVDIERCRGPARRHSMPETYSVIASRFSLPQGRSTILPPCPPASLRV